MKTSLLVLCLAATATTSVFAETYRVPIEKTRQKQQRERPTPLSPGKVDGVIPRGIRGGNFLQMFNPKAPAKYGTSQEAISYDPSPTNANPRHDDSGKWKGIKFFVFQF
ncbi:MAG: hypothetical protein QOJ45_1570 [Verrucomicrobiota bacterium]|jgi:hypothetical protein